jgi:AcrR family transcriptional regulator
MQKISLSTPSMESDAVAENASDAAKKPSRASRAASPSYHHGDLRNALIVAGRRLVNEIGANELSLRHLARSVGVSIAAPSHHFEGKDGLLAAIAADGFHELAALRRGIVASTTDPLRRLYRIMECYVSFAEREKGLFYLMVGPRTWDKKKPPRELNALATSSFNLFASAVCEYASAKGWAEKDFELLVHPAWSVEHGVAMLILSNQVPGPGRKMKAEHMVLFSLSMLLNGIAAGPENFAHIESQVAPSSAAFDSARGGRKKR